MHRIDFQKLRDTPSATTDDLRQALRQFASGVTVVTAEAEGELYGITVSAFTSISLDPPVIMVAINTASPIAAMIAASEHFAVHILPAAYEAIAERFARSTPGPDKYGELQPGTGRSGAPLLQEGMLAVLDCVLDQTLLVGTHMLMFGRVVQASSLSDPGDPLIYYHRSYRHLQSL